MSWLFLVEMSFCRIMMHGALIINVCNFKKKLKHIDNSKVSGTFLMTRRNSHKKDISKNAIHFNHFSLIILCLGIYQKDKVFFAKMTIFDWKCSGLIYDKMQFYLSI